jgi:hypothetical protein
MASESIGSVYPTQIPGYDDAADIQAALRLYHYGSTTAPANEGALIANSVAGHIKALDTRLDSVESAGVGSDYVATEPVSPANGFIWVDADATLGTDYTIPSAIYQNSQPTTGLSEGMLWVDKDSSPLKMYVYDSALGWREIGA